MNTPLYDELVVKYYLSKGIKPFSYPHEPVGLNAVPKVEVKAGDYIGRVGNTDSGGRPHIQFDLFTGDPEPKAQSNGYFNL